MKKQIVALLSVLLISPVFAEEVPSSEKIQLAQQLIKLDGSVAAVSSVKESMMQQIKQNLPPYIKADFFSILDEELNIQEILDKQQTVYARIFSKEEMQKSIAFYSTPEGARARPPKMEATIIMPAPPRRPSLSTRKQAAPSNSEPCTLCTSLAPTVVKPALS